MASILKRSLVYIFDLRPAKQNEHKASKILKKISNFMTDGRRDQKNVQQAVVEWQKGLKLPNMSGFLIKHYLPDRFLPPFSKGY